jgi:RNAse (barnase) inhibitor barstar
MTRQEIIIEGKNFSDLGSFYDEIDRVLTNDLDWKTGHNLDAFNDLLRGGFGVYEY